jgi:hypothetical protein
MDFTKTPPPIRELLGFSDYRHRSVDSGRFLPGHLDAARWQNTARGDAVAAAAMTFREIHWRPGLSR